jgi:hypothetical protein
VWRVGKREGLYTVPRRLEQRRQPAHTATMAILPTVRALYADPGPISAAKMADSTSASKDRTSGSEAVEGIANAKARGIYRGRKATIDPAKIKQLKADGMELSVIAKTLRIGRACVYPALAE